MNERLHHIAIEQLQEIVAEQTEQIELLGSAVAILITRLTAAGILQVAQHSAAPGEHFGQLCILCDEAH